MEQLSLNEYIKKALVYYDKINTKYNNLIKSTNIDFNDPSTIIFKNNDIEEKYEYEILGYFDNTTKIWLWGWIIPNLTSDMTSISRELLEYGLKLEPTTINEEHVLIKSLLVNSRILIEEDTTLGINLAIYSYLSRIKYLFIYPQRIYLDKSKSQYITVYCLIKK